MSIKINQLDSSGAYNHYPISYSETSNNADKIDNYHASDFVLKTDYTPRIFTIKKIYEKNVSFKLSTRQETLKDTITFDYPDNVVYLVEKIKVSSMSVSGSYSSHSSNISIRFFNKISASVTNSSVTLTN